MKRYIHVFTILIAFMIPLWMIGMYNANEIKKYSSNESIIITESSFGPPVKAVVGTIEEKLKVSGRFEKDTTCTIDLVTKGYEHTIFVKIGDEVFIGDELGNSKYQAIQSPCNGIVEEIIDNGVHVTFHIINANDLIYVGYLNEPYPFEVQDQVRLNQQYPATLTKISNVVDDQGIKYYFKLEEHPYRLYEKKDFIVNTNHIQNNVIIIPKDCIYYSSMHQSYVIREVNEQAEVLKETPIIQGISDQIHMSVSGITEQTYCDIEYGKYMNNLGDH